MVQQTSYWKALTRRKKVTPDGGVDMDTKLNRVLGLYDLTALGVGSTLGAGVYVLAGQIAKEQAGPSVMLSFAIAALASLLAGVCYAEFGARVPKAGSAYVYSYVCIGEFAAFVIGWNLILEYVIGAASVCRGFSLYLDSLINNTLQTTFAEVAPIEASFLGSYFDFFAFGLALVFGVSMAFGVETSTMANNFVTCLNIFILLFVIIAGAIKADFTNWSVDPATVNATNIGNGGFFPYGFEGTLRGAATCFFGFVGFDCIATTGEEVRNPRRNIPRSILLSLLIIFLCYFGVSTVLTLMLPYYETDPNAPLPYAFRTVGWPVAMWIVTIGGLIGLLASLFGALFPLPRVMYSMAQDGLLFRFLGRVNHRFQVPVIGSIFAACFTALIAGLFDLAQLVSLLSIGTLLAYSVVAICVTILRYMDNTEDTNQFGTSELTLNESSLLTSTGQRVTFKAVLTQLFNCQRIRTPNALSTRIVGSLITLFCLLSLGIGLLVMLAHADISSHQIWALVLLGVLLLLTVLVLLAICLQPREAYTQLFRVPLVPIVPAVSIFINIYLMLQLDTATWIRFGIWMLIGLPILFACWCMYDFKNPSKRNLERISFRKALRQSNSKPRVPGNGYLAAVNLEAHRNVRAYGQMSKPSSVKSLDEIRNLNDVGNDLIEVRNANGKLFYIEDSKSNTSTVTLTNDEPKATDGTSVEEVKSVIAILDDVLEAADDGTTQPQGYGRQYSVDSEMYPSVIETTIVATVHSSSSDSSGGNLEDLPESENETTTTTMSSPRSLKRYNESKVAAEEMLNELFESQQFYERLAEAEAQRNAKEAPKPAENLLRRVPSEASLLSSASIDDPLHSEKFKNKLSQIFMQPPPLAAPKAAKEPAPTENGVPEATTSRPTLQQSKSEVDLRQLLLRAIESRGQSEDLAEGDIPRAPKFDPILYKTMYNPSAVKKRPALQEAMTKAESVPAPPVVESPPAEALPPVHFKSKLEQILMRGPSHRTQQRPEVQVRRPQSTYLAEGAEANGVSQTDEQTIERLDAAALISNARKSLKPISSAVTAP